MSDLDDFDLRPKDPGPEEFDETYDPAAETTARPKAPGIHPILPVAALGLFLIGLYFLFRPNTPSDPPSPAVIPTPAPAPASTVESAPSPAPIRLELPPLNKSDAVIRDWIAALSANPQLAAWLIPDQLIRKFVAAVENIADDED
ncbi:MAG: hypothetical protein JJE39_16810, partial [Vicinamibacteria bacterium]|nr:hypothetical protein [Vicinamibacteria bacterium]